MRFSCKFPFLSICDLIHSFFAMFCSWTDCNWCEKVCERLPKTRVFNENFLLLNNAADLEIRKFSFLFNLELPNWKHQNFAIFAIRKLFVFKSAKKFSPIKSFDSLLCELSIFDNVLKHRTWSASLYSYNEDFRKISFQHRGSLHVFSLKEGI